MTAGIESDRQKPRKLRKIVLAAGSVCAVLLALWLLATLVVLPAFMGTALDRVNSRLGDAAAGVGATAFVGGIDTTIGNEIVLKDIELGDSSGIILKIPRVRLGFSIIDLIRGRRVPDYVVAEEPFVEIDKVRSRLTRLRSLVDRLRGIADSGDRADGDPKAGGVPGGSLPDRVVLRNGTIRLSNHPDKTQTITLSSVEVSADRLPSGKTGKAAPGWAFDGSLVLAGFKGADQEADPGLSIHGVAATDGSISLDVTPSSSLVLPAGGLLPVAVALGGLDLDFDPDSGRLELLVRDMRIDDIGAAVARITSGAVGLEGRLTVQSAAVSVDAASLLALADVRVEDVARVAISGGGFGITLPDGSVASVSDAVISVDRVGLAPEGGEPDVRSQQDLQPFWDVDVSCQAEVAGKGASPLRIKGSFDRSAAFVGGHLQTGGVMPVALLSVLHNRLLPWGSPGLALDVDISREGSNWKLNGSASATGLTYFWTKLCLVPITDISFDVDFGLVVSLSEKVVNATFDRIRVRDFVMSASFEYEHQRGQPVMKASVDIPKQSCQAVFDAIPPVVVPRLKGTRLSGEMAFSGKLKVGTERSSSLVLSPDMDGCTVLTFGDHVDIDSLMSRRYIHRVEELDDEPEVILTGPGSGRFAPLEMIPVHVQQAALATEDMAFFRHKGFAPGLIKRAILLNLDKGWYVYGGSTITQQLVKNLFLSREKTLARKLEEAIIVWELERRVPKERTLELYLNCIEFGYHIYGIRDAAMVYFNKTPMELTVNEAAFIMATKPNPKSAFGVYERRTFGKWWVERIEGIAKRLWAEMDAISERDYVDSWPWIPTFWYGTEGVYVTPEIIGKPDVPAREDLGLPARPDEGLPLIRVEPGDDGDGAGNDDDGGNGVFRPVPAPAAGET
ncbi:MAG TPA: biosynthetic peptidoglycan transglycosylase [Myxococcota bacterium]|nr:biosynthetic peptidoglycan transglycosylase [Myxococcota bacterium]